MRTLIICLENFVTKQAAFIVLGVLLMTMTSCYPRYVCGAMDTHFVSNETGKAMVYEVAVPYPGHEITTYDTLCCKVYIDTNQIAVSETNTMTHYWQIASCSIGEQEDSIELFTVTMVPYDDVFREDCSGVRAKYYLSSRSPGVYNLTDTMSIIGGTTGLFNGTLGKYVSVTTAPGGGNVKTNYCHLHITDELLGEMEKDYSMLEKFPEFYGTQP